MRPVIYSLDSLASNSMKSKNPYSGCRQVEVAKTLDTTDPNPSKNQGGIIIMHPYVLFEPRSQDGVPRVHEDTCPTLNTAQGGQRQPCVAKPAYCVQGNCIDRSDKAGCNGKGWREGASFTLNTIDRPAVAYLANGKDTVGTLLANAGTKQWLGNQEAQSGDYHIIEEFPEVYRQSSYADYVEGKFGTLRASGGDFGGGSENLVKNQYIVRRLTPTECARLQGFADGWGIPDYKEEFAEEEYLFWLEVRNTYALINGKKTKEYSKEQMLTWYNKLHSDSSEYKMWGNGVALPPTLYCMQGITNVLTLESECVVVEDNTGVLQ